MTAGKSLVHDQLAGGLARGRSDSRRHPHAVYRLPRDNRGGLHERNPSSRSDRLPLRAPRSEEFQQMCRSRPQRFPRTPTNGRSNNYVFATNELESSSATP